MERLSNEQFADFISQRLLNVALGCIPLTNKLFSMSPSARNLSRQLARCSASSAANYRAVRRARSQKERYAKLCIVVEELDETEYWLEFGLAANYFEINDISLLLNELKELIKVLSKAKKSNEN